MSEQVETGDKVSWEWNGSHPNGVVGEVKAGEVTVTSNRGNEISKTGDSSNPAVHIERSGNDVVKLANELDVEKKGDHANGETSNGHKEEKEEVKADEGEKANGHAEPVEEHSEAKPNGTEMKKDDDVKEPEKETNGEAHAEVNGKAEETNGEARAEVNGKAEETNDEARAEENGNAEEKKAEEKAEDKEEKKEEPKTGSKRKASEVEDDGPEEQLKGEQEANGTDNKKQKTANGTAKAAEGAKRGPGRPKGASTGEKKEKKEKKPIKTAAAGRSQRKTRSQAASDAA